MHCISGLTKSPLFVAIALIHFRKFSVEEAVNLVRFHRNGSINEVQSNWLHENFQKPKIKAIAKVHNLLRGIDVDTDSSNSTDDSFSQKSNDQFKESDFIPSTKYSEIKAKFEDITLDNIELDKLSFYSEGYSEFKKKRNNAFSLLDEKKKDEKIFAGWMLSYVLQKYKEQHRTGSQLDLAIQEARDAGRKFLSFALNDTHYIRNNQAYFNDQGYSELNNAFLFTAPLDALNYLRMKPNLEIKELINWGVLVINDLSADKVHLKFLEEYNRVLLLQRTSSTPSDPFDEDNMNEVLGDLAIYKTCVPDSLKKSVEKMLSYLGY